jgi:hypothetical protein
MFTYVFLPLYLIFPEGGLLKPKHVGNFIPRRSTICLLTVSAFNWHCVFDARNMNSIKYELFLVIQDLLQVYVTSKLSSSLAVIKQRG